MAKLIDLTGKTFGLLTAVQRAGRDSTGKTTWVVKCACGGTSEVVGLNLKHGVTKSCGCLKHRIGEANPRYRPVTHPEGSERKRTGAQFKHWRKSVIVRCPVCIRCGAEAELHVHHLKGVFEHPNDQFDPLNGVTLCASCHKAFHRAYGRRKGFTEMDAEVFIDSPIAWLVTRHSAKNGVADLKNARHFIDLLIELEEKKAGVARSPSPIPAAACTSGAAARPVPPPNAVSP